MYDSRYSDIDSRGKQVYMRRTMVFFLSGLIIGGVFVYLLIAARPVVWNTPQNHPDSSHISESVENAIHNIKAAETMIRSSRGSADNEKYQQSIELMVRLREYYIPMTEVRHLVYEADRLYRLKKYTDAEKKLSCAKTRLESISRAGGKVLQKASRDLMLQIDTLIIETKTPGPSTLHMFSELGRHVNLMVLRGELLLSDKKLTDH